LAAALLALPAMSTASSVVPLTIEEMAAVSQDVVHVRVVSSRPEFYKGILLTRHRVEVLDSMKGGHREGGEMELAILGGTAGPLTSASPGMPTLAEGEETILFLNDPLRRLPREVAEQKDKNSPLIQSPQIVGGFQGKFEVLRPQRPEVGKRSPVEPVVVRKGPSLNQRLRPPTLDEFKDQVRSIAGAAKEARIQREIPAIGAFEIVEEDEAASALRYFDPIPAMARSEKRTARESQEAREEFLARRRQVFEAQAQRIRDLAAQRREAAPQETPEEPAKD